MIFEVKNVSFSDKVKYVREKLHLSQQMLAKELGIAFSTVNRWENCKGKPQYAAVKNFYDYCTKHGIEFDD